jgi:transposase
VHPEKYPWVTQLLARKPAKVVAVAIANKTARIAWAVLTKKQIYRVQSTVATEQRRLGHEKVGSRDM